MAELPKIVVSRMRHLDAGPHPDADILAAFGERRLQGQEREFVLRHLGGCAECREVVSLASPEVFETTMVVGAESTRSFRMWQWGAVAASFVVVAAAVWVARPEFRQPQQSVNLERSVETQEGAVPSIPATGEEDRAKSRDQAKDAEAKPKQADELETKNMADKAFRTESQQPLRKDLERSGRRNEFAYVVGGTAAGSSGNYSKVQPQPSADAISAPDGKRDLAAPQLEVRDAANAAPAAPPAEPAPTSQAVLKRSPAMMEAAAPAPSKPEDAAAAGKLAEAETSQITVAGGTMGALRAGSNEKPASKSKMQKAEYFASMSTPTLRLSDQGELQERVAGTDQWRSSKIGNGERLRVMAFRGTREIWVAGDNGALYRSNDNGSSWTKIPVGVASNVAILTIKFSDASHGELTTSSRESWISSDSGNTWTRKP
jgi:hypothetical protein